MRNIIVIGGGTGLSVMLRSVKQVENIDLTAIVTVADDGGNTGRVRRQFHISVMGDVCNVMCTIAKEEGIFTSLMNYRFNGEYDNVGGHNPGNLILTTMTKTAGGSTEAICTFSKLLNVKGQIIPSSLQIIALYAVMEGGTIVHGGSNISSFSNRIEEVFYQQRVEPTKEALRAIHEADVIVYGIGSLYTSIMPNPIVDGVIEQLHGDPVEKIYPYSAMTQPGETDGFTLKGHVAAVQGHSFSKTVDIVITHNNRVQRHIPEKYKGMGGEPIRVTQEEYSYQILYRNVLDFNGSLIRHDPNKTRDVLGEIINSKDK